MCKMMYCPSCWEANQLQLNLIVKSEMLYYAVCMCMSFVYAKFNLMI